MTLKAHHILRLLLGLVFLVPGTSDAQVIQWVAGPDLVLDSLEVREHYPCAYVFRNADQVPLVIETVRTSCGCTNPSWPVEPIAPGEEATISVVFRPDRSGSHSKKLKMFFLGYRKGVPLRLDATAY